LFGLSAQRPWSRFLGFLVRRFPVYRWTVAVAAVIGLAAISLPASAQRAESKAQAQQGASLGIAVEPNANEPEQNGVVVLKVFPDGPAAWAGVKQGDVITKADDRKVDAPGTLLNFLASHKPGDKVTLHVKRDGKEKDVAVTLESRAESFGEQAERPERPGKMAFLGVQTSAEATQKGALVTGVMPKSPAAKAGLRSGDVITRVDNQAINSPPELVQAIRKAGVGKEVTITAQRGDKALEVKAKLEAPPGDMFGGPGPGLFPGGGPGLRPPGTELFDLPDRVRQLQDRVNDLERRLRALEQQKGKG
jgi:S1-C subfamily serine protease